MPALDGWDLERYRRILRARAEQLRLDPRIRGREDESDLVQQTLLRAAASQAPVRGESDAERVGWLLQIQNNVYIDLVREHHADKRDVEREQADLRAALNESTVFWIKNLADGEPSPAERASRNEERELLDRGLELLPPRECEAMTLQLKEHLSMAEIAERLGTTKGTVARLIRSGSSRLAGLIEQLQRRPAGPEEGCADA